MAKKAAKTKTKKKVRSAAERSAAAKASWQLRRLRSAKQPTPATPPIEEYMYATAATTEVTLEPPITLSVTREGDGIYLTIANNGALSRTRVRPETLRVLALDALQMVG